jgi:hypothetical protein
MADKERIKTYIRERAEEIIAHYCGAYDGKKKTSRERFYRAAYRSDHEASLRWNPAKGTWYDDPMGLGGDVFDFIAKMHHLDPKSKTDFPRIMAIACERLGIREDTEGDLPPAKPLPAPAETKKAAVFNSLDALVNWLTTKLDGPCTRYKYTTIEGETHSYVLRVDGKDGKAIWQAHERAPGEWTFEKPEGRSPLYRAHEIYGQERVVIVEGEKCVDALMSLGIPATTSRGGAGKGEHTDWGAIGETKEVILWADADPFDERLKCRPGIKHMAEVQAILASIPFGPRVRVINVDRLDLPAKGDVVDFLERLGDVGHEETLAAVEKVLAGAYERAVPKLKAEPKEEPQASKEKPDKKKPQAKPTDPTDFRAVAKSISEQRGKPCYFPEETQRDDLWAALWKDLRKKHPAPRLAVRDGRVVRLRDDRIEVVTGAVLSQIVHQTVDVWRVTKSAARAVELSHGFVQSMLQAPPRGMPELKRVAFTPFFTGDGRLISSAGYYSKEATFLVIDETLRGMPTVEKEPEAGAVTAARELLLEMVKDFPFVSDSDRTHFFATLFLPFVRPMIEGCAMGTLFESSMPRTGKGLLVETAGIVATGREPAANTFAENEDERKKAIFAMVRAANAINFIDNLPQGRMLNSASLASVLTSYPDYEDRTLGSSVVERAPNFGTWCFTGNNVRLSQELTLRLLRCRMEPTTDRPDKRSFSIPDLPTWVRTNRPNLVHAVLTIVASWIAAGKKPWEGRKGRFQTYAWTIGGIMEHAGFKGFLANESAFVEAADEESETWRALIAGMLEHGGADRYWSSAELIQLCDENNLLDCFFGKLGKDQHAKVSVLGKVMKSVNRRVYSVDGAEWQFWSGKTKKRTVVYWIQRAGERREAEVQDFVGAAAPEEKKAAVPAEPYEPPRYDDVDFGEAEEKAPF